MEQIIESAMTSNWDLMELADKLGVSITDIVFKDQLFGAELKKNIELLHNGRVDYLAYVINLQDSDQGSGTHWVALFIPRLGKKIIYFDSFGVEPPQSVMRVAKYMKRRILMANKKIQKISSGGCGQYCVMFIYYMVYKGANQRVIEQYLSDFS